MSQIVEAKTLFISKIVHTAKSNTLESHTGHSILN